MDINELVKIKEEKITTEEEKKKIEIIKKLMFEKDWMFRANVELVMGILEFLEVPKDEIESVYLSLISPENFIKNHPQERI